MTGEFSFEYLDKVCDSDVEHEKAPGFESVMGGRIWIIRGGKLIMWYYDTGDGLGSPLYCQPAAQGDTMHPDVKAAFLTLLEYEPEDLFNDDEGE